MQFLSDLVCSECKHEFKSASLLLQHYASHAMEEIQIEYKNMIRKKKVPNLYPINIKKDLPRGDNESDSGVEDVNPLKFCLVTMDEKNENAKLDETKSVRKYQCTYCLKRFGWSTDLKRHILIHTGERPFQCNICNSSFTRNFLLQNHQRKVHNKTIKSIIPQLKPLFSKKHKSKLGKC